MAPLGRTIPLNPGVCSQSAARPNNGDSSAASTPSARLQPRAAVGLVVSLIVMAVAVISTEQHTKGSRGDSNETGRAPASPPRPEDEQEVGVGQR